MKKQTLKPIMFESHLAQIDSQALGSIFQKRNQTELRLRYIRKI